MAVIIEQVSAPRNNIGTDIGQYDLAICCHYISKSLHDIGIVYGNDYWFDCSYIHPDGRRYMKYIFKDEPTAMLAKLKGIAVNDR